MYYRNTVYDLGKQVTGLTFPNVMNLIPDFPIFLLKQNKKRYPLHMCACRRTYRTRTRDEPLSGPFLLHLKALEILTLEADFKFQRNGKKRECQFQEDVFCGLEKLHLWPSFQILINSLCES